MRHFASAFTTVTACMQAAAVAAQPPATENNPPPRRERIEWCDIWIPNANDDRLPAVLLIGDSICKGYYGHVAAALQGKASVARFATSAAAADPAFIDQLDAVLRHYKFTVIHFNNGLHGAACSEDEYAAGVERAVNHIRKLQPQAKIILCGSTPVRDRKNLQRLAAGNERVRRRNEIMQRLAASLDLPCNDLYGVVIEHPDWWRPDGVHFHPPGYRALGDRVASLLLKALDAGK